MAGWKKHSDSRLKFCSRPHGQINENWKKPIIALSPMKYIHMQFLGWETYSASGKPGHQAWRCRRAQAERDRCGCMVHSSWRLAAVWWQYLWVTFCTRQFSPLTACSRLQTTHPVTWRLLLISASFQTQFPSSSASLWAKLPRVLIQQRNKTEQNQPELNSEVTSVPHVRALQVGTVNCSNWEFATYSCLPSPLRGETSSSGFREGSWER